jgi:hypothetical protein
MEDRPIAGLLYSTKDIGWQRIAHYVRSETYTHDSRYLREYGGIPDVNAEGPYAINSLSPIRQSGAEPF